MAEATSCGGVVIFRGKILVLYKNYKNRYEGWVLPKGTVEPGEEPQDTAVREVLEESGASVKIVKYIGDTQYTFNTVSDTIKKTVHWYLCAADSFYSKPQKSFLKIPGIISTMRHFICYDLQMKDRYLKRLIMNILILEGREDGNECNSTGYNTRW